MKAKYDDLINRFIDNEVTSNELNEIDNLLLENEEFKVNFKTHKYVHENLYDLPIYSAPETVTENIMSKILSKITVKYKKSYFFRVIVTSILLMIITSLFLFFSYLGKLDFVQQTSNPVEVVSNYTKPFFIYMYKIFASEVFRTVSGIAGFVILLSFYFTFNSFKNFKDKLKQF
ncbi:MAG: hypothetical protein H6609_12645 [Ignavibacteriales bacterium]|nr:hypothetical protein [Ignavibacteriales bacterium]